MIIKQAITAMVGSALALFASPANANETATAAQISGVINPEDAPNATGDQEFQELFASWKDMDTPGVGLSNLPISIPSRMPVEAVALTSNYGMRDHPILRKRRQHDGVDLAAPTGTPVYATADGIVARADRFGSYGNYIQIEHGGQVHTRFAHLSGYAVSAGDRVMKGQLIGYVGSTGRSTGPHLHYEVRVAGQAVDPVPYMLAELPKSDGSGAKGGPE